MKTKPARIATIQPRLRIRVGDEVALGPGKAELLQWVKQTGSISEAARKMGMSYMRAWKLIQIMNQCFREPVVLTSRGGKDKGGAEITKLGRKSLKLYQKMENDSLRVCERSWQQLEQLLKL
jgi:molybdate transport system regulatory protein